MLFERFGSNNGFNSRVLVETTGDRDDPWTRNADRLLFLRLKDFDFSYDVNFDTAIYHNRVQSPMKEKEISKLSEQRNSHAYKTKLTLYENFIAKHRAQQPGSFLHLQPKSRRTFRRNCRLAMARKGAEQVGCFAQRIRKITEDNPFVTSRRLWII